jgi:hypothetical protein
MNTFFTAIVESINYVMMNSSLALAGKVFSLLLIIGMILAFWKANKDPKNSFNFNDLLVDNNGKAGGSKMRLNLAFIICSWVLIYYTLNGTVSEWLFASYLAAFVADRVSSRTSSATPADGSDQK